MRRRFLSAALENPEIFSNRVHFLGEQSDPADSGRQARVLIHQLPTSCRECDRLDKFGSIGSKAPCHTVPKSVATNVYGPGVTFLDEFPYTPGKIMKCPILAIECTSAGTGAI